jgi:hypothetical protein
VADIRKQLGLDYLRGSEPSEAPTRREQNQESAFLQDALIAYGRPMLEKLRQSPQESATLYTLIDQLQIPIDLALKVTEQLEAGNYLKIVHRDLKGDHELKLTEDGRRLLG